MMSNKKSTSILLLIWMLAAGTVLAHAPELSDNPRLSSTITETVGQGNFDPTYLAAAVCAMPGHHGEEAFARRVALVRMARAHREASVERQAPPLYRNLGRYTYPVTTDSQMAQRYFDQGMRLTYAFNHIEALRSFDRAQQLDPECAMCYWGEAYVLGPNINAPMEPAAVGPAVSAINEAVRLADAARPREKALIAALAQRYSNAPDADQAALNQAYADAMSEVAAQFPDDADIGSLYADALMNLSPWDYWKTDRRTPKPAVADVVVTLEHALSKAPNHPYAIHLYIHAVEASATPERAEAYADRLAEQIPGAGHIVHMPSHIYFRIGRFSDSIAANKQAIAADEAYMAQAQVSDFYAYGYYPHNVHFLLESARMAGDGDAALKAANKLPGAMSDEVAAAVPWIQVMFAAPYFTHAQFSGPAATLRVPEPSGRFPYIQAMWHYARGVAQAMRGDAEAAKREASAIKAIEHNADFSEMVAGGVPAPDLLRLARHVVTARVAQAQGNHQQAVEEYESAVAIQDDLPYMEPPYWYYPVRQSLGAALLLSDKPQAAERVLRHALKEFPNNGWALFGLMQAQKAQGEMAAAAQTQSRLEAAWLGSPAQLGLARL
jgi:tetratricopeptide (TPR) repeat protein